MFTLTNRQSEVAYIALIKPPSWGLCYQLLEEVDQTLSSPERVWLCETTLNSSHVHSIIAGLIFVCILSVY